MTTVGDVVRFLGRVGQVEGDPTAASSELRSLVVTGVTPEDTAGSGHISWLSPGRMRQAPERLRAFRGALLLAPADVGVGRSDSSGIVVGCRSPKFAFAQVVSEFFPELLASPWAAGGGARAESALIAPDVRLAAGVVIGAGVVLHEGVEIGPGTCLAHTAVGKGTRIGANCSIGLPGFGFERAETGEWFRFPHVGRVEIGSDVEVGSNTCIDRGALGATRIEAGAKIDNLVHIAHNVVIGAHALVIANTMVAGSVVIGEGAWIAPSASILNQLTVGANSVIGLGAVVIRNVPPGMTVVGNPARSMDQRGRDAK